VEVERDLFVGKLTSEAHSTGVQLYDLRRINDGLVSQVSSVEQALVQATNVHQAAQARAATLLRDARLRFEEELPRSEAALQEQHVKDLAAQCALASQSIADALAHESAKRREEHDVLVRMARQEHDSIVCSLKAELLAGVGELGQARESYDRLVADRRSVMEANATTGDVQEKGRRHEVDLGDIPRLPCAPARPTHRVKQPTHGPYLQACVARPVTRKECEANRRARAAMQTEWDRLRAVPRPDGKKGTWDEDGVREWATVRREARLSEEVANVGMVFGICVEQNPELPEADVRRKFKVRAVFLGKKLSDEDGNRAIFQELGSCPASLEAARCADCYGLAPGNEVLQADAEQAYTQALLTGATTWVRLPRDPWPPEWVERGLRDPVCPLILALYGHPDSGGCWEAHCESHLRSVGFVDVDPWRSCFWHPRLKLFLVVYVDDFKLAGPKECLEEGWALIRQGIKTDIPHDVGLYLGCIHRVSEKGFSQTPM
jgi:hypothetical protein